MVQTAWVEELAPGWMRRFQGLKLQYVELERFLPNPVVAGVLVLQALHLHSVQLLYKQSIIGEKSPM